MDQKQGEPVEQRGLVIEIGFRLLWRFNRP